MSHRLSSAACDSTLESASAAGTACAGAIGNGNYDMTRWSRDEDLPEVYFSSTDDGDGAVKREDNDDDVFVIGHLPAAKKRLCSSADLAHLHTQHQAPLAPNPFQTPVGSATHQLAADQSAADGHATYTFTHFRRCSVDIAAAIEAKDQDTLLAILTCIHLHLQVHPPPRPNHKIRDHIRQLTKPDKVPEFLSSAVVCPFASAIQEHWSDDACIVSIGTKKKIASSKKKKIKITKGKKKATKTKKIKVERAERGLTTFNRDKALKCGYIACTIHGCRRIFTSLSSMLHHLRDKHCVLDSRLTKNQRKENAPNNKLGLENGFKSAREPTQDHFTPPAPVPQIASVSDDSVGARLLRLSGWTGGGLGSDGRGIIGT
jgi:hypothetical protein